MTKFGITFVVPNFFISLSKYGDKFYIGEIINGDISKINYDCRYLLDCSFKDVF